MATLNAQQIKHRLPTVPTWSKRGRAIQRRFEFKGFLDAIDFVDRVARKAEKCDHHPDIDIRWNKVTLAFSTHSEGGLTKKDFAMAETCDTVFAKHFES
ncbi:MAG TPA: 4a-hydroxytetrahydrobiopterin dehydratase [Opitutaceae bacterium]|jgi:4a-hydroxytetrahydrobiopterin dehydratase